jgi:hypothetical protein
MKTLREVLAQYSAPLIMGEQEASSSTMPQADHDALRRDLQAISTTNKKYFLVCVLMLVVLFSGSCVLVFYNLQNPGLLKSLFAVTGVSFLGVFTQMVRLWKEKVSSDIILVLIGSLGSDQIMPILEILLRKLN